jgi:K+ transporter
MLTWWRGREIMFERLRTDSIPLEPFLTSLLANPPHRVPGTAVCLSATPEPTPHALHNLIHNKVLHERLLPVLELAAKQDLRFELMETTFFLSRQKIVPVEGGEGDGVLAR